MEALKEGDELRLLESKRDLGELTERKFETDLIPKYSNKWEMRAIPGPNGAPDYFSEEGMELFFATEFRAQVFSDRAGIRLTGPELGWAKEREVEGRHPSTLMSEHEILSTIHFI